MCLCCRARLYFPLLSIVSKLVNVPRRITFVRLAFSTSVNSLLVTSSTLEKALRFFTLIIFERSKKKIITINEKEHLEITLFCFLNVFF